MVTRVDLFPDCPPQGLHKPRVFGAEASSVWTPATREKVVLSGWWRRNWRFIEQFPRIIFERPPIGEQARVLLKSQLIYRRRLDYGGVGLDSREMLIHLLDEGASVVPMARSV